MKTIKFQVDNSLWEKFFRLYPGQGERSAILRKIVRHIIVGAEEHIPLDEVVAKRIIEDQQGDWPEWPIKVNGTAGKP